jgi:hypothetical protein
MYDVYYTTGYGNKVGAGSDLWVNNWIECVAPKLTKKSVLLIHRSKPKNYEEGNELPLSVFWQSDDPIKFDEMLDECENIHILHGHYYPSHGLIRNLNKIKSYVMHNSIDLSLKAGLFSDAPGVQHFGADSEWENNIIEKAEKRIWVGVFDTPKHANYKFENIPNYYEFIHNKKLSDSTIVGFAARTETRKRVWYLENIKSVIFTNAKILRDIWEKKYGCDFRKSKVYNFDWQFHTNFFEMDWGIAHCAFNYEPFGYGIFQAVDWGKLPIISNTWNPDFGYPFRADNKKEFENCVENIKKLSYEEKEIHFNKIKMFLSDNYSDKELWTKRLLDIYIS